jgi:hypothetical protein
MNADPTVNAVVFEVEVNGKMERMVGQGATKSDNCITQVWADLSQKHNLTPQQVKRVYTEWSPTPADIAFLDREFSDKLNVSFSFDRPAAAEWDAAFARVREIIAKSNAKNGQAPAPLPILRDVDDFTKIVASLPLTARLGLFLAHVSHTKQGNIDIQYVMNKAVQEENLDVQSLWQQAFSNLAQSLEVNAAQGERGQPYFVVQREQGLVAGALGLPNFHEQAEKWVGSPKVMVSIPDPNTLIVCDANSSVVQQVQKFALNSSFKGGAINFTPSVLLIENGKLSELPNKHGWSDRWKFGKRP